MKNNNCQIKKPQRRSLAARFLLSLINFYQKGISPQRAACCRFSPTCSSYAKEAITLHGAFRGGLLSVWRILRCNPFGRGGYDPVPSKGSIRLRRTVLDN